MTKPDELATGAQLVRLNRLALLPASEQITKAEASELITRAVATGKWKVGQDAGVVHRPAPPPDEPRIK